jgi:uncharacterized paraquat-inducible protein A
LEQISYRGRGIATYNPSTGIYPKPHNDQLSHLSSITTKIRAIYKEDEQSPYCLRKSSAKYVKRHGYCSKCQYFHPAKENNYRCPYDHIPLRTSPRKKEK